MPGVVGAKIDVAVPDAAMVIVEPAENTVVPLGANHTSLLAVAELTIVMLVPPCSVVLDAKTVSWFMGAVLSTVRVDVDSLEIFPAASITYNLYAPSSAGANIDVEVPDAACVIVEPAENTVVPLGANHTVFVASQLDIIVTAPHPCTICVVINTYQLLDY